MAAKKQSKTSKTVEKPVETPAPVETPELWSLGEIRATLREAVNFAQAKTAIFGIGQREIAERDMAVSEIQALMNELSDDYLDPAVSALPMVQELRLKAEALLANEVASRALIVARWDANPDYKVGERLEKKRIEARPTTVATKQPAKSEPVAQVAEDVDAYNNRIWADEVDGDTLEKAWSLSLSKPKKEWAGKLIDRAAWSKMLAECCQQALVAEGMKPEGKAFRQFRKELLDELEDLRASRKRK